MDRQPLSLKERRSRLEAARDALVDLRSVLHQASGSELAELMAVVDEVAAQASAARVEVTVEAVTRGQVTEEGTNPHGWVREHAPSLRQGGAAAVARVAVAVAGPASSWRPEGVVVDPGSALGLVWAGVVDGSVSPGLATAVLGELERLAPLVREEATPTVAAALLELGRAWGPGVMRRLRPRLLAEHGLAGVLYDVQGR